MRGRSQVLYKYLPGSVFQINDRWYMVTGLKLREYSEKTDHLLQVVYDFVDQWTSNKELEKNLYPNTDRSYYFGEIDEVEFELFPLVFYCTKCANVHPYKTLKQINKQNPKLLCEFCRKGNIKQHRYALVHANGDIQPLLVKSNQGSTWREKYDGIKMIDTRSYKTATWYNYKRKKHLGNLGVKRTTLPLTKTMKEKGQYTLSGTILTEGDIYYPALRSFVNLENETLMKRKEKKDFPFIQIGALIGVEKVNRNNFKANFENKQNDTLKQLWLLAKTEEEKEFVRQFAKSQNVDLENDLNEVADEVNHLFNLDVPVERIVEDRFLHEFIFTWFENDGKTLNDKIEESVENREYVQEALYRETLLYLGKYGIEDAMILEKFPLLTLAIGFTRRSFDRNKAVLNPFRQKINERERIIIPVLKSENEAIVFKFDPVRVLAWLIINGFFPDEGVSPQSKKQAHALIYKYLDFNKYNHDEFARMNISYSETDKKVLCSVMVFRLIHSYLHSLLQASKSILGLDIDNLSEYIFPSSLAGAIYVSKLEGGGMGALITAFENDLKRWINGVYEKINTCLYDPVCHQHSGACHACMYLKFSCAHFNHGLSRYLLIGGTDKDSDYEIKGFFSPEVDDLIEKWGV